jgi:chaperonin GroES
MKFKPNADRILIKPADVKEQTSSGLYIPDMAREKPNQGTVVAVGNGKYAEDTGHLMPLSVKVGDKVIYPKHIGTEVVIEGEQCLIMRDYDLLGIIK